MGKAPISSRRTRISIPARSGHAEASGNPAKVHKRVTHKRRRKSSSSQYVTPATAASREHHEAEAGALDAGIKQLDIFIKALKVVSSAKDGDQDVTAKAQAVANELQQNDANFHNRDWGSKDTLLIISDAIDEAQQPTLEYVLGVLGVSKLPQELQEVQRKHGSNAYTKGVEGMLRRKATEKLEQERRLVEDEARRKADAEKLKARQLAAERARKAKAAKEAAAREAVAKRAAKKAAAAKNSSRNEKEGQKLSGSGRSLRFSKQKKNVDTTDWKEVDSDDDALEIKRPDEDMKDVEKTGKVARAKDMSEQLKRSDVEHEDESAPEGRKSKIGDDHKSLAHQDSSRKDSKTPLADIEKRDKPPSRDPVDTRGGSKTNRSTTEEGDGTKEPSAANRCNERGKNVQLPARDPDSHVKKKGRAKDSREAEVIEEDRSGGSPKFDRKSVDVGVADGSKSLELDLAHADEGEKLLERSEKKSSTGASKPDRKNTGGKTASQEKDSPGGKSEKKDALGGDDMSGAVPKARDPLISAKAAAPGSGDENVKVDTVSVKERVEAATKEAAEAVREGQVQRGSEQDGPIEKRSDTKVRGQKDDAKENNIHVNTLDRSKSAKPVPKEEREKREDHVKNDSKQREESAGTDMDKATKDPATPEKETAKEEIVDSGRLSLEAAALADVFGAKDDDDDDADDDTLLEKHEPIPRLYRKSDDRCELSDDDEDEDEAKDRKDVQREDGTNRERDVKDEEAGKGEEEEEEEDKVEVALPKRRRSATTDDDDGSTFAVRGKGRRGKRRGLERPRERRSSLRRAGVRDEVLAPNAPQMRLRRESSNLIDGAWHMDGSDPFMMDCVHVWEKIRKNKITIPFREPVNVKHAPNYFTMVKKPMDLSTVKKHLEDGQIGSPKDFYDEMMLICKNALTYNEPTSDLCELALEMRADIQTLMKPILRKWRKDKNVDVLSSGESEAFYEKVRQARAKVMKRAGGRRKKEQDEEVSVPVPLKTSGRGGRGRRGRGRGRGRSDAGRKKRVREDESGPRTKKRRISGRKRKDVLDDDDDE